MKGFYVACLFIMFGFCSIGSAQAQGDLGELIQLGSELESMEDGVENPCDEIHVAEIIRDISIKYVIEYHQRKPHECDAAGVAAGSWTLTTCNFSLAVLKRSNQVLNQLNAICPLGDDARESNY